MLLFAYVASFSSCKKLPELWFSETNQYYSYVDLDYGENERHYLDLFIPKSDTIPQGMMLYIHGGGWVGGDKEVFTDRMKRDAELGYVSAAVNYRYADGKKVTCEDILDDIELALSCIKTKCLEYNVVIDKVMLAGGSAGGHLSLMFAYTRADSSPIKPVAVASYSGPSELKDNNFYSTQYVKDIKNMISKISGVDLKNREVVDCIAELDAASPLFYAEDGAVPTLIFHGMKDDVVPYSNALILYERLKSLGVTTELVSFENSGHGLEADPKKSEYAEDLVLQFMNNYL
jgi:acetyl esterase/lipase